MSALDIDLLDYLRLEVEDPAAAVPVGRYNLIKNPSGDLGAWGWVTPVAGSAMAAVAGPSLQFTSPGGVASYFYSEKAAVANPYYVAARWMPVTVNGYYRARLEFLNAAGALLSASTQTAYLNGTGAAVALGPFQAPASTAYVRLRFDHYSTNAGANPTAGQKIVFNTAAMASASDSASLGVIRTNLITNPSFETNVTGYTGTNATLARVTTQHLYEAAAMSITATTAAPSVITPTGVAGFPVTAGAQYGFQVNYKAATTGRALGTRIIWYTAAGVQISASAQTNVNDVTGGWTMALGNVVAPATAAFGALQILYASAAAEVHYVDAVIVEKTDAVPGPTWFDGNVNGTVGGITYAWTGAANNSTSTATSSNLEYIDPVPYTDILGGSVSLDLNRKALDVGVLQALIKDASLDPATADLIRPGKAVRLRTLNNTSGLWEVLAQGTLDKGRVTYDLRKPADKQATITLATTDVNQVLANTSRPDGVQRIADLPYVLEGAGVPWNVNGSGNQVATATIASSNDQGTALDQVVLTRDTALGYAWTTKEGVLTAYDDRTLDYYGTGTALLDESDYSALDVSFDPDDCINEVTVNLRRFNAATAEVVEESYGPYRDQASIDEWGVHRETFTVHGIGKAAVAAYAASILAANAQPALRINSVTVPIRGAADLVKTKALLDLYAKVRIVNTDKGLDQTLRPTGIRHLITARRWSLVLTFAQVDSVATPIPTTPQGGSDADLEGVWIAPTLVNSWVNYGLPYALAGYMRKNGIVYLKGLVKSGVGGVTIFTLPPGYRPAEDHLFTAVNNNVVTGAASTGTAHTHADPNIASRLNIGSNGQVFQQNGDNGFQSLSGISFPAEA